jgi:hypothetical protein
MFYLIVCFDIFLCNFFLGWEQKERDFLRYIYTMFDYFFVLVTMARCRIEKNKKKRSVIMEV